MFQGINLDEIRYYK